MFYGVCSLIFLLVTISGWGQLFHFIFSKNSEISVSGMLLNGTVGLSVFFCLWAFFFPLNLILETFIIGGGVSAFFLFKIYLSLFEFFRKQPFSLVFIGISVFAAGFYPFILDHFGYYVPTINWLSNFGLVKGIANLDLLLGQMSLWHIFQAGFSNFVDPFLRINVFAAALYIIYSFEKRQLLLLIMLPVFLFFIQSPSPDLPVIAFSLIILNEILQKRHQSKFLLILAAFIFAVKPTMLWPILALMILNLKQIKNLRYWFPAALVLVLFFIKNLWCFGYPVFPVQALDFGITWTPNSELMQTSANVAVQKTFDMQYSVIEITNFTAMEGAKNWLLLPGMKGIINIALIISLIVLGIYAFINKQKRITAIFIAVFIKSVLVVIFSAQYRFFLDVFFVVAFILLYQKMGRKIILSLSISGMAIFLTALSFPYLIKNAVPSFRLGQFMAGFQKEQLVKPMDYEATEFKTFKTGNLQFNLPVKYPFIFKTPFPAISPSFVEEDIDAGIFPQKIGKDLKDGFIWKKISENERKKLQKILEETGNKNP